MARFRLLLLALSLWPIPAGASLRVPSDAGAAAVSGVAPEYPHEAARPGGLEELLHRHEAARRDARTRLADGDPAGPVSLSDVAQTATDLCGLRIPPVDHVPALCERLPYYATAPPRQR
jgi:hypothetical protein